MTQNPIPLKTLYEQFAQLYHAGEFEHALTTIEQIVQDYPNHAEMWSNAASTANRLHQWDLSIEYAQRALQIQPHNINAYDCLSFAFYQKHDLQQSGQHGLRALQLRDEQIHHQSPDFRLPEPQFRENGQQIIAFSLFGNSPKYLEGALHNALLAPQIYPDWRCRFYVDDSVPENIKQQLREYNSQVIEIKSEEKQWIGTVWRFLALDDDTVARVIFRDVDSLISLREAQAVQEWVNSGKLFHTIRDSGSHTELILAGLWGAVGGAIDDVRGKLRQYFSQPLVSRHFADQFFLREHIWQFVRQDVLAHDRLFGFMNAVALPDVPVDFDVKKHHIGSCQMVSVPVSCPFPDGTMMLCQIQSRVLPMHDADFQWFRLPEMRLLREYRLPVQQGQIQVWLPHAYYENMATGNSIIQISTRATPKL